MLNIRKSSHISRRDKGIVASYHLNFLSADIKLPQYFCKATVQNGIAHDFTQFVKEHFVKLGQIYTNILNHLKN